MPTQRMIHLGFGIDSSTSSYSITDKYRRRFQACRSELVARGTASRRDLQRWLGKCCHLRLIFPAQALFTFQCRSMLKGFGDGDDERRPLPQEALEEIKFWTFVDSFTEPIPFLLQQHVSFSLYTDASGFGWGAHLQLPSGPLILRDYWTTDLFGLDICCKEALAVLFGLQSVEERLHRRHVDVYVDNQGLELAWNGLKSRSRELTGVLQSLFLFCIDSRVALKLIWVPTDANPADAPSRDLDRGDSMLAPALRRQLWRTFGPFAFDLMALPSNVLKDPAGRPLPFFSRYPTPSAAGVNVFAQRPPSGLLYVFPVFGLIPGLIHLFVEWAGLGRAVDVVLVLPTYPGKPSSWACLLAPYIQDELILAPPLSVGVLLFPSSRGYQKNLLPAPFGLSAFRCRFPPSAGPTLPLVAPVPPSPVKVLVFADSMLRPLQALSWPAPFRVLVHSLSGATLERVVQGCLPYASTCDVFLLHAGVNDVSRVKVDFEKHFAASCDQVSRILSARLGGRRVLISTVCQTKSDELNMRVAYANQALRSMALAKGWSLVSNDNVHFADLHDTVHLNAAGTARLYRNILISLRSA